MKKLLLTLFIFSVHYINAQQSVSIHLTEKDGLPDIEFYSIVEDSKGYIWLAADKGLYRYNGNDFKLFNNPQKKGHSLFGLKFDSKGRLWCNNLAGQFFYIENDELVLFKDFENVKTLRDFIIFKEHLIIKNDFEAITVNIKTKVEKSVSIQINCGNSFSDMPVLGNSFYESFDNFLYKIEDPFFKIKKKAKNIPFHKISERGSVRVFQYKNTVFYFKKQFSNNNKEVLFKIFKNKNIKIKIQDNISQANINHVYTIDNKLWILTNKGIFICEIINNELIQLDHLFPQNFISDALIDSNLNYWFTTINDGIFVIPNQELKTFNSIYKKNKKDISDIAIIDSTQFFVATLNGKISKISSNKIESININNANEVFNISFNKFSNNLLVSSRESNISYDLKTKQQKPIHRFFSKSITVIDKYNYLLSLSSNASIYNTVKDTVSALLNARSYSSTYESKTNRSYVSYIDGFWVHDLNTNSQVEILNNNKPILGSLVAVNNNGLVCIATHNNGVLGFKDNTKIFSFNIKNGLESNIINALEFQDNTIWVATDKGIQSYNYNTKKIQNITKQDGLTSGNIKTLKVVGNRVIFGSNLGLFSFNSKKIEKERQILNPYFTTISIEEKDTILQPKYTLKQANSEIKIGFNTNGFQTKDFIEYAYNLEGYSSLWIPVENNSNFVKFNTLPSGNYKFHLKAKNKFSNNYSLPITINLSITSPYYKTLWFYLLCFIITACIIWFYFNKKTKRLKKAQETELEKANISKELVLTQLENLRSQMNPHFIFNALNSIQDYIILNEKKLARIYLVKFSRLIRTYLEHSQKNVVSLAEEIKTLKLYLELEKDRFDDDFNFTITVDKTLDLDHISMPSLFIQPYIENALKHGLLHKKENKKLDLQFIEIENKDCLRCIIIDNGIGRQASNKIKNNSVTNYKSFSTNANNKRVNLLNTTSKDYIKVKIEDLIDSNQKPIGTKVIIDISLIIPTI